MRLATLIVLLLLTAPASAARLIAVPQTVIELPMVPHYELASPPITAIKPPRYTEHRKETGTARDNPDNQDSGNKTLWQRLTLVYDKTLDDPIAFLTAALVIANFVLAGSTIGLWIVTWISGRRQSRETRRTIETMERTERRQLRAYVKPSTFNKIAFRESDEGPVRFWRITPIWENAGQTPTRNAFNQVNVSFFSRGDFPDQAGFPDFGLEHAERALLNVGPRSTMIGQHADVGVDTLWMARAWQGRIFVWGWMEYDDVFANDTPRRRTEFCNWVDFVGDPAVPRGEHIDIRVYRMFNGADQDCYRQPAPRP